MSEMTFTQAADEVRKLLRGLKAIDVVASAMDRAGSVENAVKESETKLVSLRAEIGVVEGEVAAAVASVSAAKDEAKQIKAKVKDNADELIAKAEAEAAAIKLAADKYAHDMECKVEQMQATVRAYAVEVETKAKELADIDSNITKARTYLNKLAGA